MAHARDLYKTKLCTLYQRGNCPRQSCSFAHGEAELRRFPAGGGFIEEGLAVGNSSIIATHGRPDSHRTGDLWDRLDRRRTPPYRRRSPSREGRGRSQSRSSLRRSRASRSFSPQRSASFKSERRESKRLKLENIDGHLSDVSDHYGGDIKFAEEDNARSSARSPTPSPRDAAFEQLRQVQAVNENLIDDKARLEKYLENMKEQQSAMSTKTSELESKLSSSEDEMRRWNSKLKKMVKLYMRNARAQEDVKKTHLRLHKLAEDFSAGDDSDYYNLSDIEPDRITSGAKAEGSYACHALNVETEGNPAVQNGPSGFYLTAPGEAQADRDISQLPDSVALAKKKRLQAVREKTYAAKRMQQNGGNVRLKTNDDEGHPDPEVVSGGLIDSGENEKSCKVDMFMPMEAGIGKDRIAVDDLSLSLRSSPTDKGRPRSTLMLFAVKGGREGKSSLPSTGLAAHAGDYQHDTELEEDMSIRADDSKNPNLDLELGKSYQIDADNSYRIPSPHFRVGTFD